MFRRISAQKRYPQKFNIHYELYFVKCICWLTYKPKFLFTHSFESRFISFDKAEVG